MYLTFLGAAGEVTGSCFLVEAARTRFLVDCGMFQGGSEADRKNWKALAFDPKSVDFVLLTHAHIDHSGLIPRLAALGYSGPVFCTQATADLASVMLPDSGHVQEIEAQWQSRVHHRTPTRLRYPAPPLYTVAQAQRSLRLLHGVAYDKPISPHASVSAVFYDAGHILGSAIIEVTVTDKARKRSIVFSGDLGLPMMPVVRDPTPIPGADVLLVESTYGNRRHRALAATLDELSEILTRTLGRQQGNIVFPAFAVGRTQSILCVLAQLFREGRSPPLEIYVDSPMATAATEVTARHRDILDQETRALLAWIETEPKGFRLRFTGEPEDSMALNAREAGIVIISASGMCEGGRIRHHLRHNLPREGAAVVMTGFQAAGTLGRKLVDGAQSVRLFGEDTPVRATVHTIGGLSAHADQQGILDWLGHFEAAPGRTFVVHGESGASAQLAASIRARHGWRRVTVPGQGERFRL